MSNKNEVSVLIPISERYDDIEPLYYEYKAGIEKANKEYEFIYILDGDFPGVAPVLKKLQEKGEPIKVYQLSKWFGEATCLNLGFEKSSGDVIVTLPAYYQIEPVMITELLDSLDAKDMVIARRWPRNDSVFNKIQANIFHAVFNSMTGDNFHDLGCGARVFKRQVAEEIPIYGDQHRFFPVLASRRGFKVKEIKLKQSEKERETRVYGPGVYIRRLLDILTVFFLVKFTKKPLRFFGLIGSVTFILGGLVLLYLAFAKLFIGEGIADRPLLLLGSLLFVLGIQIFAIGLIGELIIFTHAKDMKEYTVEQIV